MRPHDIGERTAALLRSQSEVVLGQWGDLLATEAGRHMAYSLLELCGFNAPTYAGIGATEQTAYNEGRRGAALELFARYIKPHGAEVYAKMVMEAEQRALAIQSAEDYDKGVLSDEY